MKTSQQSDPKIHLKILSQSLQYERYGNAQQLNLKGGITVQNCQLNNHMPSPGLFFTAGSWQRNMCRGWAGFPDEATGMHQSFLHISWFMSPTTHIDGVSEKFCIDFKCKLLKCLHQIHQSVWCRKKYLKFSEQLEVRLWWSWTGFHYKYMCILD